MADKKQDHSFVDVYPFTTENIGAYFERLDMKDKEVLTVGSSLDQAFNAIVLGAKKITVLDINPNTYEFFKLKRNLILQKDRKEIYTILTNNKAVSKISTEENLAKNIKLSTEILPKEQVYKANNYLQNDKNYQLLREGLKNIEINFITGNIFKPQEALEKEKYDRIILSNILQNLEYFSQDKDKIFELLTKTFTYWKDYLSNQGILQLLYLYTYSYEDIFTEHPIATYNLREVYKALKGYSLDIEWINNLNNDGKDAIVTYSRR